MGIPRVNSFFWCMSLETGTKVIGLVNFLYSAAVMVFGFYTIGQLLYLFGDDQISSSLLPFFIPHFVSNVIYVLLSIILVIAAFKRSTRALRVWVWLMVVVLVVKVVMDTVGFAFTTINNYFNANSLYMYLAGLAVVGITAYFIVCVNSYYLLLKSEEDKQRVLSRVRPSDAHKPQQQPQPQPQPQPKPQPQQQPQNACQLLV